MLLLEIKLYRSMHEAFVKSRSADATSGLWLGGIVKLINYCLVTELPVVTSADPHIRFLSMAVST